LLDPVQTASQKGKLWSLFCMALNSFS